MASDVRCVVVTHLCGSQEFLDEVRRIARIATRPRMHSDVRTYDPGEIRITAEDLWRIDKIVRKNAKRAGIPCRPMPRRYRDILKKYKKTRKGK